MAEAVAAAAPGIERLGAVDTADTGMRAATFHISVDGTRVLNYAEWVDADSHISAANRRKAPDEATRVGSTPGVHGLGYQRFLWWHSVAAT